MVHVERFFRGLFLFFASRNNMRAFQTFFCFLHELQRKHMFCACVWHTLLNKCPTNVNGRLFPFFDIGLQECNCWFFAVLAFGSKHFVLFYLPRCDDGVLLWFF